MESDFCLKTKQRVVETLQLQAVGTVCQATFFFFNEHGHYHFSLTTLTTKRVCVWLGLRDCRISQVEEKHAALGLPGMRSYTT